MTSISSINNPLIKEIKTLHMKKARIKSKSFIIEGIKMVEEAVDNNYPLKRLIFTDQLLKGIDGQKLYNKIQGFQNLVHVTEAVFKDISDTESPQGILAVASFTYTDIDKVTYDNKPFLLFLDGIQDPGNMGTIIRTADAFNIDALVLGEGCVDPYNPKVVRSTMGSIFRVKLCLAEDSISAIKNIKDRGVDVITSSLQGKPIKEEDFDKGFVLIVGNESKGVSKELLELSDSTIKIPMPGKAESLNASIATSIIMYEAMSSRSLEL